MPATYPDSDIDGRLTDLAVAHSKKIDGLSATRIFPSVPVKERCAQYDMYPKGFRDSSGSNTSGKHPKLYEVQDHTQPEFVSKNAQTNTLEPDLCDHDAVEAATEKLLREDLDEDFCKRFLQPGVWGQDVTGGSNAANCDNNQIKQWSDADADPAADIKELSHIMSIRTGGRGPNKICLARDVWDAVEMHPKFGNRLVTRESIAAKFRVDEVIVMEMIHIKSGFLFLFYQDASYTLDIPKMTAGVNFVYSGRTNPVSLENSLWVRKYKAPDPGIQGHYIEVGCSLDFCMVSPDCGTLIQNLV